MPVGIRYSTGTYLGTARVQLFNEDLNRPFGFATCLFTQGIKVFIRRGRDCKNSSKSLTQGTLPETLDFPSEFREFLFLIPRAPTTRRCLCAGGI